MTNSPPKSLLPNQADSTFPAIVSRLLEHLRADGLITDTAPGGVARMLMETVARELATLYQTLEAAHRAGYLDTAQGPALDEVVALLGLTRAPAGRLFGRVLFSRASGAPKDQEIVIPAGLRVAGRPARADEPAPLVEVVAETVLLKGQLDAHAAVQEISGEETPELAILAPGRLHLLPRPLLGVGGVINLEPLTRAGIAEDDERLRARARVALRAGELATAEAIEAAARAQGAETVSVREPKDGPPGRVIVRVGDLGVIQDPRRWAALEAAVYRAKAAGVRVTFERVVAVAVVPALEITPMDAQLAALDKELLVTATRRAVAATVAGLPAGATVSRRKLEGAALALADVREARLLPSTRLFALGWADGEPVAQDDLTALRATEQGDWALETLEQPTVDLQRFPPRIVLVGVEP